MHNTIALLFTMNVSFRLTRNPLITYVREARYLGVVIQLSGTDKDVHRQMRKYYAGINTLMRRFYACSYDVKCYLFRSYISNMYCGQFWFNSTKYSLNKLRVSYNNSCRRLLRLPMRNSASEMFVQWIEAWLTDRRQRVVVSGETSVWSAVSSGVP